MSSARVVIALGGRAVKQTFRRPQLMAPLLIFPTALLAIQTAGAGRATQLEGFPPVDSFLSFMLAGAMIQSAMLSGNSGGIALAQDIEMGFTDRLLAAPIPRWAIVVGRLVGTAALGLLTAAWFILIGVVFGVDFQEGLLGILVLTLFVVVGSVAFGTIGAAIALRSGQASVVQGMFPLVFVILFLSTAFFPEDLLLEPARTIAAYNPLSFIVEAVREPIIDAITVEDMLRGTLGLALMGGFGALIAWRGMRYRLGGSG